MKQIYYFTNMSQLHVSHVIQINLIICLKESENLILIKILQYYHK